ncbi:MAG: hydrogenase expression/formation protein HypE [Candidatus Altiarchaeales archaeon ex4484_96]|nr:MAG: hydrogenase expression/formation protein HypE [Candidatus Altiarchaeales archaeon ex4484_96]
MHGGKINLLHGGGGQVMEELLNELLPELINNKTPGGIGLSELDDSAIIHLNGMNLAYTTDSYTIKPLFFRGGDIGRLSVCGTINDLAVMGAKPLALSTAFIIGEGLDVSILKKVFNSINRLSVETNTPVVTGDTKVIEEKIGLIINTSGVGLADKIVRDSSLKKGDGIIVSGTLGDHGISVLAEREGIEFETKLRSDCAPLWDLIEPLLDCGINAMKDPTRGGLANALNELAVKSNTGIMLIEEEIPLKDEVKAASQMLGIDPLQVANEGKVVLGVKADDVDEVLKRIKSHPLGADAALIGWATKENKGRVSIKTSIGGERYLDKPRGDPVPRVC